MNNDKVILIADDNDFFSKILQKELGEKGYQVVSVKNGQEVLDKAKEIKPDLILLDIIMPIKDGFEAIAELKQVPSLKNVKIVIFSNLGQKEDIDKAMELGAAGYIVKKDFSLKDMVDSITKYIGN